MVARVFLFWVLPAVLGAVVASFLGVVADRWPRGEAFAGGRSRCRACGVALRARELVPVLGWVLLRGRCGRCGAVIPLALVLAEVAGAVVGVGAVALGGGAGGGLALAGFGGALILLALIDAGHLWLPDRVTLPLLLAGLASAWVLPAPGLDARAWGAAVGWGGLAALGAVYRRVRGRDGIGGGDGKLLGAIGAWLGVAALPWVVLGAAAIGLVAVGVARGFGVRVGAETPLPLGTMMAVAALGLAFLGS